MIKLRQILAGALVFSGLLPGIGLYTADAASQNISNSTQAAISNPAGVAQTYAVLPPPKVDLRLFSPSEYSEAAIGEPLTYTFRLANNGTVTATSSFTVNLSSLGSYSVVNAPDTCVLTGTLFSCKNVQVPPYRAITFPTANFSLKFLPVQAGMAVHNFGAVGYLNGVIASRIQSRINTNVLNYATDLAINALPSANMGSIGQPLTHTLYVRNYGPIRVANGVVLTEQVGISGTIVSATPSLGSCNIAGSAVVCSLGSVSSMSNPVQVNVVVLPTQNGEYTSTVSVAGSQTDGVLINNKVILRNVVSPPTADLFARVSCNCFGEGFDYRQFMVGDLFTYTISAQNSGPSTAGKVVLTHTLPAGVTFVGVSSPVLQCSQSGNEVVCKADSLARFGALQAKIVVRPTVTGTLSLPVLVSSNTLDPRPNDNSYSGQFKIVERNSDIGTYMQYRGISPVTLFPRFVTGTPVMQEVVVYNYGPATSGPVVITVTEPISLAVGTPSISQGTCVKNASQQIVCTLPSLAWTAGNNYVVLRTIVTPTLAGATSAGVVVSGNLADFYSFNNSFNRTVLVTSPVTPVPTATRVVPTTIATTVPATGTAPAATTVPATGTAPAATTVPATPTVVVTPVATATPDAAVTPVATATPDVVVTPVATATPDVSVTAIPTPIPTATP